MSRKRPKILDSPYLIKELGRLRLKPGAPPEAVAEFEEFLRVQEAEREGWPNRPRGGQGTEGEEAT